MSTLTFLILIAILFIGAYNIDFFNLKPLNVKIKPINGGYIPQKAHNTSACYDVFANKIEYNADGTITVKLGFSLEIPNNYKVVLVPRSSITKTNLIMQNSPGQGDPDYRGEYMIKFKRLPVDYHVKDKHFIYDPININVGDRIGQIYFEKIKKVNFILSDNLSSSERNDGGFGSTGK